MLAQNPEVACSVLASPPPLTFNVSTYTDTVQYEWSDLWVPVDDNAELGASLNIQEVSGNCVVAPARRLAAVRMDDPDAGAEFSGATFTNSTGFTHFSESSAGGTAKLLLNLGLAFKNSSGASLGTATVVMQPTIKSCIRLLPARQIVVNPGMVSSGDNNYAVVTEKLPAGGLSKVKAGFLVGDLLSDYLEYTLVMRTMVDPSDPGSWVNVETSFFNPSSSFTSRNTGEKSAPAGVSLSSNLFYELGVGFRKKSGAGGNPRGVITVIPAVIY